MTVITPMMMIVPMIQMQRLQVHVNRLPVVMALFTRLMRPVMMEIQTTQTTAQTIQMRSILVRVSLLHVVMDLFTRSMRRVTMAMGVMTMVAQMI
jgi:hypothetical protein